MDTMLLNETELSPAVEMIQKGEVVAFPTDTVYGLGADATNELAVQKIFQAKGRPTNRPINVLVGTPTDIYNYAADVPDEARKLVEAFWPGQFTIILQDAGKLAAPITAGKKTVGMRMPDLPLALDFINACGVPLATPSANSSGRPSPTTAAHVLDDLDGKIAAIIDGGKTPSGMESTILDYSDPHRPLLLRPGFISKEAIEDVVKREVYLPEGTAKTDQIPNEKHYEPKIPLYIVTSSWNNVVQQLLDKGEKIGLLATNEINEMFKKESTAYFTLGEKKDIVAANQNLFEGLRYLEQSGATIILAEALVKEGIGIPFMNRLENAANGKTL